MEIVGISPTKYVIDEDRIVQDALGEKLQKITAVYSVITADRAYIKRINKIIEDYGILEVEYISEPLCKALFVVPKDVRDKNTCLLVDIGALSSSLTFIRGDGIVSLTSFSLGGNHITMDLCEAFELDYNDAENLKNEIVLTLNPTRNDAYEIVTFGGKVSRFSAMAVNEVAVFRVMAISDIIKQCIRENSIDQNIEIYITGRGLLGLDGGKNLMSNLLCKNIKLGVCKCPYIDKVEYASIYGIADYVLNK